MAKYYISSGSLQVIKSLKRTPLVAAAYAFLDTNQNDTLEHYFYVSERGFRDSNTIEPTQGDKAFSLRKVQRYAERWSK